MAKKPAGYYSKGKVTSERAVAKANARKSLTSLKGIAGIVGGAVLEGIGGPKAKAAGSAAKAAGSVLKYTTSSKGARKVIVKTVGKGLQTTTGQPRKKVSEKVAKAAAREAAGPKAKAPFGRNQKPAKPTVGRIMSKSEKDRDAYYKSKKNPVTIKRTEPKRPNRISKEEKAMMRQYEIRKAMRTVPKGGQRAALPKHKTNVTIGKPKRTMSQILDPLKGKKVVTGTTGAGKPIKMDAQEYVLTRARFKSAGENPKNSVAPLTRSQNKARSDAAEARATKEARKEMIQERLRRIKDTDAAKANPNRYTSPEKEYGNVRQTEGLVAQGERKAQEEFRRKAIEREKIARTPRAKKEVEATLQRQRNREAILAETRKKATITRRPNNPGPVKPGRTRRAK